MTDELALLAPKPAGGWWLTEFEDRSSPRPGTDEVYFAPANDTAVVERPPKIVYEEAPLWLQGLICPGGPVALSALLVYGIRSLERGTSHDKPRPARRRKPPRSLPGPPAPPPSED
jgi:hypothetical protein